MNDTSTVRARSAARPVLAALVLVAPLFAGGCASKLLHTPQSFTLNSPPAPATPSPGATRVVSLRAAEVSPVYAGVEFVYVVGEHAIERDPYASFATPPAWMLTTAIRGYLRGTDFIRDVVPPGEGVPVDADIEPALTEIACDFTGNSPEAVLIVHFRVLAPASSSAPEREILLKTYTARRPIARREAAAIAAAWNEDLAAIAAEFIADLKAALPPPRPARVG